MPDMILRTLYNSTPATRYWRWSNHAREYPAVDENSDVKYETVFDSYFIVLVNLQLICRNPEMRDVNFLPSSSDYTYYHSNYLTTCTKMCNYNWYRRFLPQEQGQLTIHRSNIIAHMCINDICETIECNKKYPS